VVLAVGLRGTGLESSTMTTNTTKLTTLLQQIRAPLISSCPFITCALLTLDEYKQTAEVSAMRTALTAMAEGLRIACREYNNLRAQTGRWERAQGVEKPQFYPGELRKTGLPIGNCNCGLVQRITLGDTNGIVNT